MNGSVKTFVIGIFALAAMGLLMWSIIWVKPSIGDERQILQVRFTNIDKVILGTRVLFAGQPVGEVAHIEEIRDARVDTINGKVYIYQLTMKIDSNIDVYTTDQISVKTSGLLGEKAIDITPMPPQPGKPFERATREDILYASSGGSVEETFGQINKLSNKVEKVFDEVGDVFHVLNQGKFWDHLNEGARHFQSIAKSADHPDEIKSTLDNMHTFSENLTESWKKIDKGVEDIAKAAEGFMDVASLAKDIMKTVDEGKGSIGAFIKRDDFYLQLKSVMCKAETLMNDINHYGLMFSSDCRWQRQRERKAAVISQLCTPRSFVNYFNDQVDEITCTLERIQAIVCESEQRGCEFDCCFEKVFADLHRRVMCLNEMIVKVAEELRNDCCGCDIPCDCVGDMVRDGYVIVEEESP